MSIHASLFPPNHRRYLSGICSRVMCHGGKIALLGIQSKETAINWDLVVFNSLTIRGIYGREMYETWYKMTAMLQSGLEISPVVTHRFPYTAYEEAFQLMKSGQSGKIVLHWSDLPTSNIASTQPSVP